MAMGNKVNGQHQLRDIDTGNKFEFDVYEGDRTLNQGRYEQLGEAITDYVYEYLEEKLKLKKVIVPLDAGPNDPKGFFFMSKNALESEKLMILIHDSGVVRAGQWARSLIINHSFETGTMVPYIERAKKEGFGLLITNGNHNYDEKLHERIKGSENPQDHFVYVWKKFIKNAKAKHIVIVANSFGGVVVLHGVRSITEAMERIKAVAFTDSEHSVGGRESKAVKKWFKQRTRNWVSSSEELDTPIHPYYGGDSCELVSAGTTEHVWTSHCAKESVFTFFKEKLEEEEKGNKDYVKDEDKKEKKSNEKDIGDDNNKADQKKTKAAPRKRKTPQKGKVPLEIFRGPEVEKAYREALNNGEVEVYRGRIMLIGQDRAGKTSLKKSLLGLSFDPNEQSTDGVVVDPSNFSVDVDDAVDWQIPKIGDVKKNDFEDGVASIMAEKLSQSHEVREPESTQSQPRHQQANQEINKEKEEEKETANVEEELIGETSTTTDTFAPQESNAIDKRIGEDVIYKVQDDVSASNHHVVESGHDILEKSKEKSKGDMETGNVTKKAVPEMVMENLIQRLSAKNLGSSAGQETSVSIWDFAGQQLYYASHSVFFTHRAVYVLVYNLEKDLVAEAEPCVRQGVHEIRLDNHDQQTNLEALLSWLVSIHSARPKASDGGKIHNKLPYLRPPVIIVGTHADCPLVEESKKVEEKIQKSLTRKSYEQHVVRPFITVDNTMSSNDDGVKKLKEKVKELFSTEPYMGEKVPVRWFKFEQVIKSLVEEEGKNHMSLKDLERLILEVCNIEDKNEISALLTFYHDLGVIVKHGNTVVLKAEWLIDLFRKLITIRPFNDQNPVNAGFWRTLEETGILDMKLVEHVFKEKIECGETKDDILAMMENYGLIARFGGNEDPKNFHYFVPSQLKSSPEAFCDVGPSMSDPCTLYLHFLDGFIPHGLYNILVSRLITWCSKKDYHHEPKLYQSVSRFFIGRAYQYELFLIRRKRFVKVVLRSLQSERSWLFQPVAFQIREFFESSLKEITEECLCYQSLNCKICVHCPSRHVMKCEGHQLESCIDDDCLHLLPVEKDQELVCRESFIEESKPCVLGLEEWYREDPIIPVHNKEECIVSLSANTTFDLSNDQKRWLVIGICLNTVLLPTLRSFIEPKMLGRYSHLQTTNNIHTQVYPGHLTRDGKCNSLNYGSINSNEANHGRKKTHLYDYRVNSAVDLAKLYLQPFMAKFSDFDDTCDLSATLGILSSASAFSSDVQDLSSQVRKDVRNEWGHCNVSVWDEAMFATCFKLIDSLVKALCLTPEEEKRITDKLQEWEDKGVQLCMGKITDADLVEFIKLSDAALDRLTREVRYLETRQEDEARRVNNALGSMRNDFEKYRGDINKKIESLEKRIERLEAIELANKSKR